MLFKKHKNFNIEVLIITIKFTFSNFPNSKLTVLVLSEKTFLEQLNNDEISDTIKELVDRRMAQTLVFRMQLSKKMIVSDRKI